MNESLGKMVFIIESITIIRMMPIFIWSVRGHSRTHGKFMKRLLLKVVKSCYLQIMETLFHQLT